MTDVHEPRPGQTIAGRYLVESELGRGGFGVVFRGRHLEVDRPVAIKVLLRTFAAAETTAVERFRREAVLAASLTYPNTVQVYDYGETDEGVFFIVMELLNGRPLAEVLAAEGPLAPRRAVHIVEQALFTLMEAHSEGIVHRDIKPDNIMLTPLAFDPDFVKVMDFGIAKMSGATGRDLRAALGQRADTGDRPLRGGARALRDARGSARVQGREHRRHRRGGAPGARRLRGPRRVRSPPWSVPHHRASLSQAGRGSLPEC